VRGVEIERVLRGSAWIVRVLILGFPLSLAERGSGGEGRKHVRAV
jgi:hypothetical protein